MKTASSCMPFRSGVVRRGWVLAGVLSSVMAAGAFGAGMDAMPDLRGTWKGHSRVLRESGPAEAAFQIEVTRQEGELLWAWDVWHPRSPDGGKWVAPPRRDRLLGGLAPDGRRGVLVKENTWFSFQLDGENRMEVQCTRVFPDAPAGFFAELSRGEEETSLPDLSVPDLSGIWSGAVQSPGPMGPVKDVLRLETVRQAGRLLWVDDIWHPVDSATGQPGADEVRDRLTGGLDAMGTKGVLVKADACFSLRQLDAERCEVEFIRFGGSVENITALSGVLGRNRADELVEPAGAVPDLLGVWEGGCRYAQPDGVVDSSVRIDVNRQEGRLVWAENVWNPIDPITGQTGDRTWWDPMVGSLHASGRTGIMVKPGVKFAFTLLAPDRMLLELVRIKPAGQQPMGFYVVLKRQR